MRLIPIVAFCLIATLLLFAAWDRVKVYREDVNGAIKFMTWDNLRHQACLMFLFVRLWYDYDPFYSYIVFLFDAVFSLGRRPKMDRLVGDHLRWRGGKRKTDPGSVH